MRAAIQAYLQKGKHYTGEGTAALADAIDIGAVGKGADGGKGKGKGKGKGGGGKGKGAMWSNVPPLGRRAGEATQGSRGGAGQAPRPPPACWTCGGPHRQA
eukprot:3201044-Heterocapsa_arctica.AAC.1